MFSAQKGVFLRGSPVVGSLQLHFSFHADWVDNSMECGKPSCMVTRMCRYLKGTAALECIL